jgi:EAL domain-containing protein (putative c-di-GMP-specific phosphodiesterase class I)
MGRLGLELTENVFLSDVRLASEVMTQLQNYGVQFLLDDFGTGYASLKYLADLPFQYLKIDKRFVSGLGAINANEVIVDAILDLAKGLNMKVIAEGVETQEQFEILHAKGCGYFQGWYFGRPSRTLQLL